MKIFTQERNYFSAKHVQRSLLVINTLQFTTGLIQVKNLLNVSIVIKDSSQTVILKHMKELIQVRNHSNVWHAISDLQDQLV